MKALGGMFRGGEYLAEIYGASRRQGTFGLLHRPDAHPWTALDVTFVLLEVERPRLPYRIFLDVADSGELDPARNVALKNFAEIVDQPELGFTSSFDSLKGKLVWLKTELRQAGDVIWTEIIDIAKPHALWSAALAAPIRLDFPTRAAAANLRHRLYRLRDVVRASQHEFAKQADLCKIAGVFPTEGHSHRHPSGTHYLIVSDGNHPIWLELAWYGGVAPADDDDDRV